MIKYPKILNIYHRDKTTGLLIKGSHTNPAFGVIAKWMWTEKLDGTNISIEYSPDTGITIHGRTEAAQIPVGIIAYLADRCVLSRFQKVFGSCPATVFGEGIGPKIQSGGYTEAQEFRAFDVFKSPNGWQSPTVSEEICAALGLEFVPVFGYATLEQAVEWLRGDWTDFQSNIGLRQAEGVVGRTTPALFGARGDRVIVKLKTCDFVED